MNSFIILLGIYLVLGTAISIFVHKAKQSQEEYFIGGRRIGGLISAGTYAATTYSVFMMVGLVGLSFQTGIGALIFEISYLTGTILLLSIYGKKIWQIGRERGIISPMELFVDQYGKATGMIGTIIAVVALIPYTSGQVIGLALIFQNFSGFHFIIGVAFATLIIFLWAYIGGLKGVAITDALQGVFMFVFALIGFLWVRNRFRGLEILSFPNKFWTPSQFVNFTLPWIFFALTNPQVLQRLFIPKDSKSINRMIILFGLFGFFYTLFVTFIGFFTRYGAENGLFPNVADRDKVILEIFNLMRRWLSIPLSLSIIFAAVTTANSIVLTLSSMVVRDLFGEKSRVLTGRIFILLLTLLVFLFSITRPNYIVELSVASSSILLCFLPLLFGVLHWKHGGIYTGVCTLLAGAGTAIVMRILRVPLSSVYTLVISSLVFVIGGFLERRIH